MSIDSVLVYQHLTAFLLGMPRFFALALLSPQLGEGVLEGQMWLVLVLALYLPVHPLVVSQLPPDLILSGTFSLIQAVRILCLFAKEAFIGLCLGFLGAIPFFTLQSTGFFIDSQRGASQAEGTDILTARSSSPMAGILFMSLVYLFYTTGAFLTFLGVVYSSFELWPVPDMLPVLHDGRIPIFFAGRVAWLATYCVLLSAPVTLACLLADVSLGLINRFAPQLNAYVLAMPVKCGLAAFLLCLYLLLLLRHAPMLFQQFEGGVHILQELFRLHG